MSTCVMRVWVQDAVVGGVTADPIAYAPGVCGTLHGIRSCDGIPNGTTLTSPCQLSALEFLGEVRSLM